MEKVTLKIQGMDCASCAAVIEHDLKKQKGISSASVNYATEKAYLEYDSATIKIDDIKKNIKDLGYKVLDENKEMDMAGGHDHVKVEKKTEIKKLKTRFILSLVF